MQKSRIFYKNWLYLEDSPFDESKPLSGANFSSLDKGWDLSTETLIYSNEIYDWPISVTNCLFLKKTSIFKYHSQHKVSTKRIVSLSCIFVKTICAGY